MLPAFFRCFLQKCVVRLWGGGGPGSGGQERHSYCIHAQNTGFNRVSASLYNTLRQDVEQDTLSQASMLFATMTKHWYLPRCCLFVQHTALGCGTSKAVTSVHAIDVHAQSTGICSVLASLYYILRKDAEQDTLSQASVPSATMPKALVFTVFSLRCTTHCARMCNKKGCHKRPCLWHQAQNTDICGVFCLFVQHSRRLGSGVTV